MKLNAIQFYGRPGEDVLQMFGLSADLRPCKVVRCWIVPVAQVRSLQRSLLLELMPWPMIRFMP